MSNRQKKSKAHSRRDFIKNGSKALGGLVWAVAIIFGHSSTVYSEETNSSSLTREIVPSPPPHRVMRNVLDWTRGESMTNVQRIIKSKANVLCTFPTPTEEVAGWPGGLKPLEVIIPRINGQWGRELDQLHKAGIRVWTSMGSVGFDPNVFAEYGLEPEKYYAVNFKGKRQMMLGGAFGKSVYAGCYNNPDWMDILTQQTMAFADGGFDGVFYDVGGYADASVYYCHCEYCKKDWKKYLVSIGRNPATAMPVEKPVTDYGLTDYGDMGGWVKQEYYLWRMKMWEKNFAQLIKQVKAKHPNFRFCHNMSVRHNDNQAFSICLMAETDIYDYVHWEEWDHGATPHSILPSYLIGTAAGKGKPVVVVWNFGPMKNESQSMATLAESFAAGGCVQNMKHPLVNRRFNEFIEKYEDYYVYDEVESMANVAVVVSWWSRAIEEIPHRDNANPSYWMGQMLLDMQVPFDYIIAERDLKPEVLAKYKTIVLPDWACISDKQIATIKDYLKNGGGVIMTGITGQYDERLKQRTPTGRDLIAGKPLTDTVQLQVGKGRLAYFAGSPEKDHWVNNPRDPDKSKDLQIPKLPPNQVQDWMAWVWAETLPVEIRAKITTTMLIKKNKDNILIHLINYNMYPAGEKMIPNKDIQLTVKIPADKKVKQVKIISPDFTDEKIINDWKIAENKLRIKVDELQHYSVVIVGM